MHQTSPEEYRERRRRLAEAFRSGEFQQAFRKLKNIHNCYCPLGVACEVYRRETGLGRWVYGGISTGRYVFECPHAEPDTCNISHDMLPAPVQDYYAFTNPHGGYANDNGTSRSFMMDNDGLQLPLSYFAELIESPPAGLFRPETL